MSPPFVCTIFLSFLTITKYLSLCLKRERERERKFYINKHVKCVRILCWIMFECSNHFIQLFSFKLMAQGSWYKSDTNCWSNRMNITRNKKRINYLKNDIPLVWFLYSFPFFRCTLSFIREIKFQWLIRWYVFTRPIEPDEETISILYKLIHEMYSYKCMK